MCDSGVEHSLIEQPTSSNDSTLKQPVTCRGDQPLGYGDNKEEQSVNCMSGNATQQDWPQWNDVRIKKEKTDSYESQNRISPLI